MTPHIQRPLPQGSLAKILNRPIAHRGLHDAACGIIENTAPAFAAAIAGRYGIECDVLPSAEHEAMVFHDDTLERLTTASGAVSTLGSAALLAVPFRAGTAGMLTLEALLDLVNGRAPLVVEVKSTFDGQAPLAPRLAALAARYAGPLAFKSFDLAQIMALRAAGVEQPLGIVAMIGLQHPALDAAASAALGSLAHAAQSRPDFLSWKIGDLPHPVPARLRAEAGLPVLGWTVRSESAAKLCAPHVDQIVFEGFRPI